MAGGGVSQGVWGRAPITLRAVVAGLAIGLIGANVWPFLVTLAPLAACLLEPLFLAFYLWWASGHGPPAAAAPARRRAFRSVRLSRAAWPFALIAAVSFAVTVHAAMVILFRLTPFPAAQFGEGYDFSFIPGATLRWIAVVISAASAGVCEETGFRGYIQQPLERRFGPAGAIIVSSIFFTLIHLSKGWAGLGMVPIVLGAGLLLGTLAWASGSLIPCMIGHTLMDVGLFAYWWTQIAGTFSARTIGETGIDAPFLIAAGVFAVALGACLTAIWRLRRIAA
jgi:membrane protease YdiL (CAAX protease family)